MAIRRDMTTKGIIGVAADRNSGGQLQRVSLEMGGNNAFVVLDDADLARHWSALVVLPLPGRPASPRGATSWPRVFDDTWRSWPRARGIEVGDPSGGEVGLGPMISEGQLQRAHGLVEASVKMGAKVVEGATHEGLFYRPTVMVDVTRDMPVWSDEIFGPVAPVLAVDSEDEALELVNDTSYGLVNAVYTGAPARGRPSPNAPLRLVHVTTRLPDEAHVPFAASGPPHGPARSEARPTRGFHRARWIGVQRSRCSPV